MGKIINFNGDLQENARVSALDHGFLFGDSIYEVVSTYNKYPCFLEEHLQRLCRSADGIGLEIPYSDGQLEKEIFRTLQVGDNDESYIRIVVTRGEGEIDIDPVSCERPNVLIYVGPAKPYPPENYAKGINLALVSIKRNPREALNPGIKTGNYLNNVLAKMEANKMGAQDALMLNPWGHLTEATTSNFFFVVEGRILTPSLECGILAGITRETILLLARENGFLVEEGLWPPEELEKAQEAFLTGTLKNVMPVTHLDGRPLGEGRPGPVTTQLMQLYDALIKKKFSNRVAPSIS